MAIKTAPKESVNAMKARVAVWHSWQDNSQSARLPKKQLTLRLDVDVIEKFKATGPGWQARMNDALKAAKV